ncbi:hypothetical protein VR41_10775 [Streptomyces sp. NRRL B-1568]|nr:hypothetical protein VR41_10775 [Streptomyces sp. NRRL B-1568]
MSSGSIARRSWMSFTGGRRPGLPRTVERGRAGYALWQRLWASFIGLDLPPRPGAAPACHTFAPAPEEQSGKRPPASPFAPGWFALPRLPATRTLSAAGGDSVVLEASSPDGRTGFLVRRHGSGEPEYSLELVVRGADDAARPLLSTVTYRQPGEGERVLLVPVAQGRFGPAAAYVRLRGFDAGTTWAATTPSPVSPDTDWDLGVVAVSIPAALNEATRDAWRRIREFVNDEVRDVIDGALR